MICILFFIKLLGSDQILDLIFKIDPIQFKSNNIIYNIIFIVKFVFLFIIILIYHIFFIFICYFYLNIILSILYESLLLFIYLLYWFKLFFVYNTLYLKIFLIKNRLNWLNLNCKKLIRIGSNLKSKLNWSNLNCYVFYYLDRMNNLLKIDPNRTANISNSSARLGMAH